MGPPNELILLLQKAYDVSHFVETGTFKGSTTAWAAGHFEQVTTAEYAKSIYDDTRQRLAHLQNVDFRFGDSRDVIRDIVPQLQESVIFWLDSHWSGGETYGEKDECPLIDELQAIAQSPHAHYILVDDARLFLSPPQRPHLPEAWPSIAEVIDTIRAGRQPYYIVIIEDVIIAVPEAAKETVIAYCQNVNTKSWEIYAQNARRGKIEKGARLIVEGVGGKFKALMRRLR
jgi:hypothetical protein